MENIMKFEYDDVDEEKENNFENDKQLTVFERIGQQIEKKNLTKKKRELKIKTID
jgi:hypothetical protein